jgi:hypothetical protein
MFAKRLLAAVPAAIAILAVSSGLAFAAVNGNVQRTGSGHRSDAAAGGGDQKLDFGIWTPFEFNGKGSFNLDGAFTFHSSSPVRLRVVDAFCRGDRFRIYDHGVPVFVTTRVPADTNRSCAASEVFNPHVAWSDPTYSRGSLLLGAGFHKIRIQAIRSPFGGGVAFLKAIRKPGHAAP